MDEEPSGLGVTLPHQLGRFTLCRELGAGGMATVYLGRMTMAEGFDRLVALKTIHNHLARAQTFVDMFLDEARIASLISHPNVCSVYDFGSIGGTYFLALEYLIGEPLHELINRIAAKRGDDLMQALPYIAARILADACEGLHAAHETRGNDGKRLDIVHRDVSPQNLFVTYDGSVKVVDFGCAKAIARVTQTDTGVMKGKVSYAAPEQLRAGEVDARVDVWALGVCLWETLTLTDLFRRDNAIQSAMAVLDERIPRADEVAPSVPRQLADIAAKALERDPEQRYPSARALGRDLRAFIAAAGVSFESAELAEWMGYLFEERQREVLAMVAEVESGRTSGVGRSTAKAGFVSGVGIGEASTQLAKAVSSRKSKAEWHEEAPQESERSTRRALKLNPEPDDPVVLPTRTRAWLWGPLVLLLLAGGAYGGLRWAGIDPFGAAHASTPEIEAPESATPSADPAPLDDEPVAAADAGVAAATTIAEEPEAASPSPTPARAPARGGRGPTEPAPAPPTTTAPAATGGASTSLDTSIGQVAIAAEGGGWAQVFHGDRALGRTPVRASLPVGPQRLRVVPFGEGPGQTITVDVEWGLVNRVVVDIAAREPTEP